MKKLQRQVWGNIFRFMTCMGVILALFSPLAQAKGDKKKKGKGLTWAKCCKQFDTETCLTKVKRHKRKVKKKWVNMVCPVKQEAPKKADPAPGTAGQTSDETTTEGEK